MLKHFMQRSKNAGRALLLLAVFLSMSALARAASADDVGVTAILTPPNGNCGSSTAQIGIIVHNYGTDSQTVIPVGVNVSGTLINDTIRKLIPAGGTDTFYFSSMANTSAGGIFSLKAYTALGTDADLTNDTAGSSLTTIFTPAAPSTTGASVCGYGSVTLKASPAATGTHNIFLVNATSDSAIAQGDSFVTPKLGTTTTYFVAAVNDSVPNEVGPKDTALGMGGATVTFAAGLIFNALSDFKLDSVLVFPGGSGTLTVQLLDNASKVIASAKQSIAGTVPVWVRLGFSIKKGLGYQLRATPTFGLFRNTGGAKYPYVINNTVSIYETINALGSSGYYYFFYDWHIRGAGCLSNRTAVTATVTAGPTTVKFTASAACLGTATSFIDSSTTAPGDSIISWTYDFGDNSTATSTTSGSLKHTYKTAGFYKVLEEVKTAGGCTDTLTRMVEVDAIPTPGFNFGNLCSGTGTTFTNTGSKGAGINSYTYKFGDSTSVTLASGDTMHIYKTAGTYTATQIIMTNNGCIDSTSKSVTIVATPSSPTATGASRCGYGSLTLKVSTPATGQTNLWYANSTSDTILTTGDSLVTPLISTTRTYYVATATYVKAIAGQVATGTGGNLAPSATNGLAFKALSDFTLDSVTVYPDAKGDLQINIIDSASGSTVFTSTQTVKVITSGAPVQVHVGFKAQAGHIYSIDPNGSTIPNLFRTTTGTTFPYVTKGIVSVLRGLGNTVRYYFFYNWKISSLGCASNRVAVNATITSGSAPTVSFSTGKACTGQATVFIDASTAPSGGSIASWAYDFGDGNTFTSSKSGSTGHVYNARGNYKVILAVTSGTGCTDTMSSTIAVDSTPVASMSASNFCLGSATNFSGSGSGSTITSYYYNFGDTTSVYTSGTSGSTTHNYKYAGTHTVTFAAANSSGCADTIRKIITITSPPSAPVVTSTSSCGPGKVTLKAGTPPSGAYNFFYANATTDTVLTEGDSFVTPYLTSPATYYVATAYKSSYYVGMKDNTTGTGALILNNTLGISFNALSDFTLDSVTVYPNASGKVIIRLIDSATATVLDSVIVKVSITSAGTAVRIPVGLRIHRANGLAFDVNGSTTGGFYRNQTGTAFPYTVPGVVSLTGPYNIVNDRYYYLYNWKVSTVTCSSGRIAVKANVGGSTKPAPKFSGMDVCLGNATSFTDSSTITAGTISTWKYNFGDGNSASSATTGSVSHLYKKAGTYRVTETVTSNGGCADSVSHSVIVHDIPLAAFNFSGTCTGNATNFTDKSSGATKYKYSFGDGNTDSVASPMHTYPKAGTYSVIQIVTNGFCADTAGNSITINAVPSLGFTVSGFCQNQATSFTDTSKSHAGGFSSFKVIYADGSPIDTAFHSHTYTDTGTYNVTIRATNSNGCNATYSRNVKINYTPLAYFSTGISCRTATFRASDSLVTGNNFSWNFGDGSGTGSGQKASYTYASDNSYKVSLSATNGSCSSTHDSTITVLCTDIEETIPASFSMNVFPNPFRESTTISYTLAEKAAVKTEVLDVTGRTVATLTDHMHEAGQYTLSFAPGSYHAASGIYIIKMTVGSWVVTRQVISLK